MLAIASALMGEEVMEVLSRSEGMKRSRVSEGSAVQRFDGQGMQAAGREFVERIIHKPVASHPAQAGEALTGDAHPKVGAVALAAGPGMAGVVGTFVDDFQPARRQTLLQSGLLNDLVDPRLGQPAEGGIEGVRLALATINRSVTLLPSVSDEPDASVSP
jgi:hypothetical protein